LLRQDAPGIGLISRYAPDYDGPDFREGIDPKSYTRHPTPYTIHPTTYTLHPPHHTSYNVHPTHHTPHTTHHTPHTTHHTLTINPGTRNPKHQIPNPEPLTAGLEYILSL